MASSDLYNSRGLLRDISFAFHKVATDQCSGLMQYRKPFNPFHRSHEISAGVKLSQPRLLAGILVAPRNPAVPQKRFGIRKKS